MSDILFRVDNKLNRERMERRIEQVQKIKMETKKFRKKKKAIKRNSILRLRRPKESVSKAESPFRTKYMPNKLNQILLKQNLSRNCKNRINSDDFSKKLENLIGEGLRGKIREKMIRNKKRESKSNDSQNRFRKIDISRGNYNF